MESQLECQMEPGEPEVEQPTTARRSAGRGVSRRSVGPPMRCAMENSRSAAAARTPRASRTRATATRPALLAGLCLLLLAPACDVERRYGASEASSHQQTLLGWREIRSEKAGAGRSTESGMRVTYDYRIGYVDGPLIHEGRLTTIVFGHGRSQLEGAVAHGLSVGGYRVVHVPSEAPLHCETRVCRFDEVPYRRDRGDLEVEIAMVDACVPRNLVLWRESGIFGKSTVPWSCG